MSSNTKGYISPCIRKTLQKNLNALLMICENIFKFKRDNGYKSYINTPKMDYTM